jgi:cytochrome b6-f complex iron-sulfur subunit
MDAGTILTIAAVALIVLGGVFVLTTTASRDRASALGQLSGETRARDRSRAGLEAVVEETEPATGREVERAAALARVGADLEPARAAPPAPRMPLDEEAYGVTRRQFFNRGIVTMFVLGLSSFGATTVAFLWPSLSGGFGSKIRTDDVETLLSKIRDSKEPVYVPEGRFYVAPFPKEGFDKAKGVYSGGVLDGMEQGIVALYQKCVHLGCRVPFCKASQWFECPCHGSRYNRVGEKKGGPAPRGMDRFPVSVAGGAVTVDTSQIIQGPPIGTNTTGQEAEGPHCA